MRARILGASNTLAVAIIAIATAWSATAPAQPATAPAPNMRGDGPAPAAKPFSITRSDPGLDAVVAADAQAELIATGFGLNEGPVWVPEGRSGYLLVGGLLDNVIYKISADKTKSPCSWSRPATPATTSATPARRRAAAARTCS